MFAKQTRVLAAGEDIRLVPFARRERCPVRPGGRTLRVCASPHAASNIPIYQNLNVKLGFIGVLIKRNGYAQAGELHLNTVGDDVLGVPFA